MIEGTASCTCNVHMEAIVGTAAVLATVEAEAQEMPLHPARLRYAVEDDSPEPLPPGLVAEGVRRGFRLKRCGQGRFGLDGTHHTLFCENRNQDLRFDYDIYVLLVENARSRHFWHMHSLGLEGHRDHQALDFNIDVRLYRHGVVDVGGALEVKPNAAIIDEALQAARSIDKLR
jgi:hypothetical protein